MLDNTEIKIPAHQIIDIKRKSFQQWCLFHQIDADRSGKVDFEEFCLLCEASISSLCVTFSFCHLVTMSLCHLELSLPNASCVRQEFLPCKS